MDYWPRLKLTVHEDEAAFFAAIGADRAWMLSSKGTTALWDAAIRDGDWLIFGNETHGLPEALLARDPTRAIRIPQAPSERCLNLSTAAGIVLYESLRRVRGNV
jgi:tRNA (cytidine/uridine-2'-O-)-methyltransferase